MTKCLFIQFLLYHGILRTWNFCYYIKWRNRVKEKFTSFSKVKWTQSNLRKNLNSADSIFYADDSCTRFLHIYKVFFYWTWVVSPWQLVIVMTGKEISLEMWTTLYLFTMMMMMMTTCYVHVSGYLPEALLQQTWTKWTCWC